jgi:hypothetical protein
MVAVLHLQRKSVRRDALPSQFRNYEFLGMNTTNEAKFPGVAGGQMAKAMNAEIEVGDAIEIASERGQALGFWRNAANGSHDPLLYRTRPAVASRYRQTSALAVPTHGNQQAPNSQR